MSNFVTAAVVVVGEMLTVVPEIEVMVVFAGIPVPVIAIPATKPEGSETVKLETPEAAIADLSTCDAAV